MAGKKPVVLVAHDYVTQRGGAERVALSLLNAFPGALLVTSMFDSSRSFPGFEQHQVHKLWTDRIKWFRADPRLAMPVLPAAFGFARAPEADVVLCSSSGWAHGLRTDASKIVYCHTPARWLYEEQDYLPEVPRGLRWAARMSFVFLRRWDRRAAGRASMYIANSNVVRERIERAYGRPARVIFPPVGIDPDGCLEAVPGLEPGYLLVVSRRRGYKNVEAICEAVEQLPGERLVVVGGAPQRTGRPWNERIQGVAGLSDAQMRWLYANAKALVSVSHEDFGLTPIEAYSFGTPAVLLRAGGFLDSSIEGETCVFVDGEDPQSIVDGVRRLNATQFDEQRIRAHAKLFSEASFHEQIRSLIAEVTERRQQDGSRRQDGDRLAAA